MIFFLGICGLGFCHVVLFDCLPSASSVLALAKLGSVPDFKISVSHASLINL